MKKLHVSLTDLVESDFFDREASGTIAEDEEVKEEPKDRSSCSSRGTRRSPGRARST